MEAAITEDMLLTKRFVLPEQSQNNELDSNLLFFTLPVKKKEKWSYWKRDYDVQKS